MKLLFGTPEKIFVRDFAFYLSIQIVIWFKVILTFFLFGKGISFSGLPIAVHLPFSSIFVFQNVYQVWEWGFHFLMHFFIAVWVFLLVKHVQKIVLHELIFLGGLAVFLHNVAYWFTRSHMSWRFSVWDILADFFSLVFFFVLFMILFRVFPSLRKKKIPYLE